MSIQEKIDQAIKQRHLYFIGDVLPPDFYAGFRQWLPLAEGGDPKAMVNVAWCYLNGEGVDRSGSTGLDWYRKAASAGDPRAMLALYEQMKARQPVEAEAFLELAVATGDGRAVALMNERAAAQEKQEREAQQRDRQQKLANYEAAVVSDVRKSIDRGDRAAAIKVAEQAVADGLTWAGAIVAALALKVNVERTSKKRYTQIQGASTTVKVAGVYHTSPVVSSSKDYFFDGTATNPTKHPVTMYFNESGSTYTRTIGAGQAVKISKQNSGAETWPTDVEIHLHDPAKSRIKMTLARDQVTTIGSDGFGWKIVGGIVLAIVALVFLSALMH